MTGNERKGTIATTITLPKEVMKKLDNYKKDMMMSRSEVIRHLVIKMLKEEGYLE